MNNIKSIKLFLHLILVILFLTSCGLYKKTDQRNVPSQAKDKARDNLETGKGVSINRLLNRGKSGEFTFSSSNPMWRASLEILDFLPLVTVDYSGGIIITDWYNDSASSNESLKITVRFLATEIRANSVKVIVHSKNCSSNNNCKITEIDSKIKEELASSILKKAALLEKKSVKI